ncbi:MAG: MerR family transcriptional regulator [Phenylobacterium sp.]|nr:MerR family transcriptional regulator [Phenylobacterium sp.]
MTRPLGTPPEAEPSDSDEVFLMISAQFYSAAEAARHLGVSPKALRLYEERGLVLPHRTEAGWRAYGPEAMRRAGEVAALRGLGFSLAQVGRVLTGDAEGLEPALASHQSRLEDQLGQLGEVVNRVRALRVGLAQGHPPALTDLARLANTPTEPIVAFDLPWPWGGERFELRDMRPLNFIIGSLGSGKTRLAMRLAEALPGAEFLGLDRSRAITISAQRLLADETLRTRVDRTLAWLVEEGAGINDALRALVVALETDGGALVIDMIEDGLDEAAQRAVVAHLRRRGPSARPVFAMTRSTAILDLAAIGPDELILLCPANHDVPTVVAPYPGSPGYEAVSTCLASPAVRARTAGLVAARVDRD